MGWKSILGIGRSRNRAQAGGEVSVRSQDSGPTSARRPTSSGALAELSSYREQTSTRESDYTPSDHGMSVYHHAPYGDHSGYGSHHQPHHSDELASRFGSMAVFGSDPHTEQQLREAEAARFEALRQDLAPGDWSAMLSQVNMSLLPPDTSAEPSHGELLSRRKERRQAIKADKPTISAAALQRHEDLLRRIRSSRQ